MGLMDSLVAAAGKAALGSLQGSGAAASGAGGAGLDPQQLIGLLGTLLNQAGGLPGLLQKLQAAGLGEAAQSWVGTGANQPVAPEALGAALGPALLEPLSRQLGGQSGDVAALLAQVLPGLVDRLTPQGRLPAGDGTDGLGALLGGGTDARALMGALGGLLGRR
jgi:uncharacterized protein YidB (DUF937 family)